MKKSDISQIKFGSDAFKKKWWDDRKAKGLTKNDCGVGGTLAKWGTDCKPTKDLKNEKDVKKAQKTCGQMLVAAGKAKKNAGKFGKETKLALEAYEKVANTYMSQLYHRLDELAEEEAEGRGTQRTELAKKLEVHKSDMDKSLTKITKIDLALKALAKSVNIAVRRSAEIESDTEAVLSGKGKKSVEAIQKMITKDAKVLADARSVLEKSAFNPRAEALELVKVLTKIRDKAFVKQFQAYDKRVREFGDLVDSLYRESGRALYVLQHCGKTLTEGKKDLTKEERENKCLDLVDNNEQYIYQSPTCAPKLIRKDVAEYKTMANAIAAYSKKSESLAQGDIAKVEEIKEKLSYLVPQTGTKMDTLNGLFKRAATDLKPYKDIKAAKDFLKKAGADMKTVQKDWAGWKGVESGVLKALDALLLKGASD